MSTPLSVLDAVQPPHGYRLVAGLWLTHDLTVSAITELLLPALTGVNASEPGQHLSAPGDLAAGALLVCAAADRITSQGLLPDAVQVLPVAGRRQHAKSAVLHYQRTGSPSCGPRTLTRTLITSANITTGGLTRNREVVVVETVGSDTKGTALLPEVLQAVKGVRSDVPPQLRNTLSTHVTALRKAANRSVTGCGAVSHSIDRIPGHPFPSAFDTTRAVDRIVLAGPAFASDDSDVASLLDPLISSTTVVELIVGSRLTANQLRRGRGTVEVPTRFLAGLRARSDDVTVYAVPAAESAAERDRSLHGKSILIQQGKSVTQMIGSANLTVRGLAGRNRELVVLINRFDLRSIDQEVLDRGAVTVHAKAITPASDRGPIADLVDPSSAPWLATFVPDAGQNAATTHLSGTLSINCDGQPPSSIMVDGVRVALTAGTARVTLSAASIVSTTDKHDSRQVLVTVTPSEGRSFWTSIPADVHPRTTDPLLARLLADVDRANRQGMGSRAGGGAPRTSERSETDDGFSLPGNVRLNAIARYRDHLVRLDRERQRAVLESLFADPVEREVAHVILDATRDSDERPHGPVLTALHTAVTELRRATQ